MILHHLSRVLGSRIPVHINEVYKPCDFGRFFGDKHPRLVRMNLVFQRSSAPRANPCTFLLYIKICKSGEYIERNEKQNWFELRKNHDCARSFPFSDDGPPTLFYRIIRWDPKTPRALAHQTVFEPPATLNTMLLLSL